MGVFIVFPIRVEHVGKSTLGFYVSKQDGSSTSTSIYCFNVENAALGAREINDTNLRELESKNPVQLVDHPTYKIISDKEYPVAINADTQMVTVSYPNFNYDDSKDDWVKFCEEIATRWNDGYRVYIDPSSATRRLRLAKTPNKRRRAGAASGGLLDRETAEILIQELSDLIHGMVMDR